MENLGSLNHQKKEYEYVDGRDEEIDIPLPFFAAQFNPKHNIIERNQSLPGRDARLFEDQPKTE